jgi:crotonobetainyl-CoA:carnitine CoA-transferase CaiB-like acyl-CoA transferase
MPMSRSWALTHRNEYSIGLDLRQPAGADLFARLVARADLVLANFKPGTLAALGFSYQDLRVVNPRIVLAESSAFGATGPWSERMGYGPLVRASTGITRLWTSDDPADPTCYDATTIFPDHVAARLTAIGAVAALIRRDRTGIGAHVHVSQAEAAINQLAVAFVADSARAAGLPVIEAAGWDAVCPCAGEDEWCAISIRDERDRGALAQVMGRTTLPADDAVLVDELSAFTTVRDKHTLAELLQQNGIPAAPMLRAVDVLNDPQVTARRLYSDLIHPLFDDPLPSETGPAPYRRIAPAELRPAPIAGEHTLAICHDVLGLDVAATDRLIAEGVVFAPVSPPPSRQSPDGPER